MKGRNEARTAPGKEYREGGSERRRDLARKRRSKG